MDDISALDCVLFLVTVLGVTYLSAFCHEVGHAVLGKWQGFCVTSFGLGLGNPFLVRGWRGSRVYLCFRQPFQGITYAFARQLFASRRQKLALLAGGVMAHALLVACGLLLWRLIPRGHIVWLTVVGVNGLFLVSNLLPFSIRVGASTMRSDGAWILHILRGHKLEAPAAARIALPTTLGGLWKAIGDPLGNRLALLDAASAWLELGNASQAELLLTEAEALPVAHIPLTQGLAALLRCEATRMAGDLETADGALEEAERIFRDPADEAGLFLVAVERAELLDRRGETSQALEIVRGLLQHPVLETVPEMRVVLLTCSLCLQLHRQGTEQDTDRRLRQEYEDGRRRHPSDTRDLRVYGALGRWHMRREEWSEAEADYRKFLAAARQLHEAFTDARDREFFVQGQAELLAEARTCLERLGRTAGSEEIEALFPSAEELQRRLDERAAKRNRRRLRLGWLLLFVNVVVGIALTMGLRAWEPGRLGAEVERNGFRAGDRGVEIPEPWRTLVIVILGLGTLTLILALCLLLAGLILTRLRRRLGAVTFFLAMFPWLVWLGVCIAAFFRELTGAP